MQRFMLIAAVASCVIGCQRSNDEQLAKLAKSLDAIANNTHGIEQRLQALEGKLDAIERAARTNVKASDELVAALKAEQQARQAQEEQQAALGRDMETAERLADAGEFFDAGRILRRLADENPAAPQAADARERLADWGIAELLDDDANRDKANAMVKERRQAERAFEQAETDVRQGRTRAGIQGLQRFLKLFPESPLAADADEILRFLQVPANVKLTDEVVKRAAEQSAAQRLLDRAENLLGAKAFVQALKVLQTIVKKHPGTSAADEAEDILTNCGAWEVEITDANKGEIIERLKRALDDDD